MLAHHCAILGFCQRVIIISAGAEILLSPWKCRDVDVIQHFLPISVAFMHAVDTDKTRHQFRCGARGIGRWIHPIFGCCYRPAGGKSLTTRSISVKFKKWIAMNLNNGLLSKVLHFSQVRELTSGCFLMAVNRFCRCMTRN
jgi:hypothetical protein